MNIIGTCGNCGGPVVAAMHSTVPMAVCQQCGATPKNAWGSRVLEMNPKPEIK